MDKYTLGEMNQEEFEAMSKDLNAILEKYNCEIGVKSQIEILKRIPIKEEGIPTPYIKDDENKKETE